MHACVADVVIALRLKQARYPVGFIHCGGEPAYYRDRRANDIRAGIAYALAAPADAFVVNGTPLFRYEVLPSAASSSSSSAAGAGEVKSAETKLQPVTAKQQGTTKAQTITDCRPGLTVAFDPQVICLV
jgi:hypothetical protein